MYSFYSFLSVIQSVVIHALYWLKFFKILEHGVALVGRLLMVQWVIRSLLNDGSIELLSRSNQCSMTGVTKVVVCAILSVG